MRDTGISYLRNRAVPAKFKLFRYRDRSKRESSFASRRGGPNLNRQKRRINSFERRMIRALHDDRSETARKNESGQRI